MPGERDTDPGGGPVAARAERRAGQMTRAGSVGASLRCPGLDALEFGCLGGALEDLLGSHALPQHLAGWCLVADPVQVPTTDLERAQPERFGEPAELDLRGELDLRRAEAAEGTVRRRIGPRGASPDPDVRAAVRPAGMDRSATEDHRGERAVRPAIHDDVDVLGDQRAIGLDAGPVGHDPWVALRRRREILMAVVDHP